MNELTGTHSCAPTCAVLKLPGSEKERRGTLYGSLTLNATREHEVKPEFRPHTAASTAYSRSWAQEVCHFLPNF